MPKLLISLIFLMTYPLFANGSQNSCSSIKQHICVGNAPSDLSTLHESREKIINNARKNVKLHFQNEFFSNRSKEKRYLQRMNLEIIKESNRLLGHLNKKVSVIDLNVLKDQFISELHGKYESLIPTVRKFKIISYKDWMEMIGAFKLDPSHKLIVCGMDGLKILSETVEFKNSVFGIICPGKLLLNDDHVTLTAEIVHLISKSLSQENFHHLYRDQQSCFATHLGSKLRTTDGEKCHSSSDPCIEKFNLSNQLLRLTCEKKRAHCEKSGQGKCQTKFDQCLKENLDKIESQKNRCLELVGEDCYQSVTQNHLGDIISELWFQKIMSKNITEKNPVNIVKNIYQDSCNVRDRGLNLSLELKLLLLFQSNNTWDQILNCEENKKDLLSCHF